MSTLDPALWRDIMGYLRRRHSSICRQWFEQLEPVQFEGGLLQIATDNTVQQRYLQSQCREQFAEAAQNVTGRLVAVEFVNGQTLNQPANDADPSAGGNGHADATGPAATATSAKPSGPTVHTSAAQSQADSAGDAVLEDEQMVLSPDYCFENFITGPNNQLAYAASVAVANQPGTAYNPLFIHGGVGLGKTHLLQAICQQILNKNPHTQILYVSCDAFMNQFIACVQSGKMNEFRHRYRHVDMLVIDDIHFLANRERSQEEFFHTFNEMYQQNRQIVLSSDAPPDEIPHLEQRLVSRFQWGLVANVTAPHYETRVAILRNKARLRNMAMPDDVVGYLATRVDTNARELEGALTTLQAHSNLKNRDIDLDLTYEAFGESAPSPRRPQVTLEHIIQVVTEHYNVRLSDLQSKRRNKSVAEPRQVCMWLARQRTRFSLEEIGGHFGGRDHTTVMHSIKTVNDRKQTEPDFAEQIQHLEQSVQKIAASG
jgi:chromosomal replication initiator protein